MLTKTLFRNVFTTACDSGNYISTLGYKANRLRKNSQSRQFFSSNMVLLSSIVLTLASFHLVRCENEIVQWTGGPFEWPCKELENVFKNDGRYVEKNIMAVRGAIYEDQAVVALPRFEDIFLLKIDN